MFAVRCVLIDCSTVDMGTVQLDATSIKFKPTSKTPIAVARNSMCFYNGKLNSCLDICDHLSKQTAPQFALKVCECKQVPKELQDAVSIGNKTHFHLQHIALYSNENSIAKSNNDDIFRVKCPFIPRGQGWNSTENWNWVIDSTYVDAEYLNLEDLLPFGPLFAISAMFSLVLVIFLCKLSWGRHTSESSYMDNSQHLQSNAIASKDVDALHALSPIRRSSNHRGEVVNDVKSPSVFHPVHHFDPKLYSIPSPNLRIASLDSPSQRKRDNEPEAGHQGTKQVCEESLILNYHHLTDSSTGADVGQNLHRLMKTQEGQVILIKRKNYESSKQNSAQRMVYHYYAARGADSYNKVYEGGNSSSDSGFGDNVGSITQRPDTRDIRRPHNLIEQPVQQASTRTPDVTLAREQEHQITSKMPSPISSTSLSYTTSPVTPTENGLDNLLFCIDEYSHVRKCEETRKGIEHEMLQLYEQDF